MMQAILLAASVTLALGQVMDEFVDNDFLTRDAIRAPFESEDFLIKYDPPPIAAGPGGSIFLRDVTNTPILGAVRDGGVTTLVIELFPCGVVNAHSHPGSGENVFVTGGNINVGMVGAGRVLSSDVAAGESFQVEQGLVHWLVNDDCDMTATAFTALPSPDAGLVVAAPALFSVPDAVLFAAFPTLSLEQVQAAKAAALTAGLPELNPECVARCAGSGSYGSGGGVPAAGAMEAAAM